MLACMNIRRCNQLQLTLLENEKSVTRFITNKDYLHRKSVVEKVDLKKTQVG